MWKSSSGKPISHSLPWEAFIIATAVSCGCLLLLVSNPPVVRYLDDKAFDTLSSNIPPHGSTTDVVIVDIDNASLARIGRWPWSRSIIARLLENLQKDRPSVLVLDVMFPEAGPAVADTELAKALHFSRSVIGYDFVFNAARGKSADCPAPPTPLLAASLFSASQLGIAFPLASGIICDIPELAAAATASGFMNVIHDADGKIRRASLLTAYNGAIYPSLPLAAALTRQGSSSVVVERQSNRVWLGWDQHRLAVTDGASFLMRYRGKGRSVPYISAADVLRGSLKPDSITGKVVLVGSSAPGIEPSVATPSDPDYPGVEVHATAIENLLAGDYFYQPVWASFLQLAEITLIAFLSAWLLFRWAPEWAVVTPLLLAACAWALSQILLQSVNAFVAPVLPVIAAMGVLALFGVRAIFLHDSAKRKAQSDLAMASHFITHALGAMTTLRDVETGKHVVRIQAYLRSLCKVVAPRPRFAAYLTPTMVDLLVQLAPIHDIGKIGVPDHILRKPGELTAAEFEQMKTHVSLGKRLLEDARARSGLRNEVFFQTATDLVFSHHERWDGTGYPLGLKGDDIPIPGRLLAVADVYDALISKRHYKTELLHAEAVERIRQGAGTHFDPEIVACFLQVQDDWRRMAEANRDDPGQVASA